MATRQRPLGASNLLARDGPHLLIISHDVVDLKMAGPGIRYWELARVLAKHTPVTLAVPTRTGLAGDRFELHAYQRNDWETLRAVVERSDVLMPCGDSLACFPALAEGEQPLVIDGYDPFTVETLALFGGEPLDEQKAQHLRLLALLRQQCLVGDFFVCASERQRDWWLGWLDAHGRINPHTYGADPTLRQLVDVLPFGLPPQPPQHTRQVLKGVIPGISREDTVILWGGGIWEWLDSLTLVRAMAEVIGRRPDVRLVFPGTRHPNVETVPDMPMRQRTVKLAKELGLLDRCVFFGDWVDYAEWPNYLLEADIGISLHFDTLEARLAFRSRMLDYVWAGLPMVVTRGDATSEMVAQRELGRVVGFEDVEGVAEAILELLEAAPETLRARFGKARSELTWGRVAEPLIAFCKDPRRAADRKDRRGAMSVADDLVWELDKRVKQQERELERLRSLVAGYEQGRFIRMMQKVGRIRSRLIHRVS